MQNTIMTVFVIHNPLSFPQSKCFRTFAVWKHFSIYPSPSRGADLSDPQLLFFFRQLATDKPMAEIQALCLCQWANVLVRCRLYGSVYLVQHGKQQATLTLHQFVCAITALDFLKSFSPYPIRIRTIGKARPMEADFQGVPFTSFISHRQHPLRMGFHRQLRPLQSLLPTHLRHRVLHPPHR